MPAGGTAEFIVTVAILSESDRLIARVGAGAIVAGEAAEVIDAGGEDVILIEASGSQSYNDNLPHKVNIRPQWSQLMMICESILSNAKDWREVMDKLFVLRLSKEVGNDR
jgi:hypothetical protein